MKKKANKVLPTSAERLPEKDGKKNSGFCCWPVPVHPIQKNTQGPVRVAGVCQHTVPVSQGWQG